MICTPAGWIWRRPERRRPRRGAKPASGGPPASACGPVRRSRDPEPSRRGRSAAAARAKIPPRPRCRRKLAPSCSRAKMRCKRSERAAGERAERLGRGDGTSVMCELSEIRKLLLTYFSIYENRNYRIFDSSRSARAAKQPKAAGKEKR